MTISGSCSSFSVATTVFVSLAICAVISYGVFYYFKQRMTVIEQSQMEQARIMQALISSGLAQHQGQQQGQQQEQQQGQQQGQQQQGYDRLVTCHKEITITQNGLIEVSSDESDSDESESDSQSSDDTESKCSDKWSIGDEIHTSDSIYAGPVDVDIDSIDSSSKKIISLNKRALGNDAVADADDSSSSSDDDDVADDDVADDDVADDDVTSQPVPEFEVKIGYKSTNDSSGDKVMHLNYGNMSVSALRQLAKERGLGGEDGDLQKLKKKDLVQLLQ
jgi:hypothetical protein